MYSPEGSRSTASQSASSIEIKPPRSKLPLATPYPSSSGVGACWAPLGVAPCMFRPKPSLAFACPIPSWTIDRVFGPIRISNGNTLMCAAIVSFRSLIPRFVPAISGQQLTETYGDATRRFNRRKMFSAVFVSFEGGKPAIVRGKEPPTWTSNFHGMGAKSRSDVRRGGRRPSFRSFGIHDGDARAARLLTQQKARFRRRETYAVRTHLAVLRDQNGLRHRLRHWTCSTTSGG